MRDITPVARYLVWAMEGCGIMETQTIYRAFKEVCDKHKHPLPDNLQAEVRPCGRIQPKYRVEGFPNHFFSDS